MGKNKWFKLKMSNWADSSPLQNSLTSETGFFHRHRLQSVKKYFHLPLPNSKRISYHLGALMCCGIGMLKEEKCGDLLIFEGVSFEFLAAKNLESFILNICFMHWLYIPTLCFCTMSQYGEAAFLSLYIGPDIGRLYTLFTNEWAACLDIYSHFI